jgi:hypothetical protein
MYIRPFSPLKEGLQLLLIKQKFKNFPARKMIAMRIQIFTLSRLQACPFAFGSSCFLMPSRIIKRPVLEVGYENFRR